MTKVLCIVAGTKDDPKAISATACVEAQRDSRCWCMKSVVALQAAGPELEPAEGDDANALSKKRKLREELAMLRARCTGYLRKRPSEQYGGPAIAAAAGKTVEHPLSSSVPLPVAPSQLKREFEEALDVARATAARPAGSRSETAKREPLHEREDEHEAAIAAQENAAGSTRKEASNDSVRKPAGRLNPTTVERLAPAMSPPDGASRAAQGVAENSAASSPPQVARRICAKPGCGATIQSRNKTGYCARCQHHHEDDKANRPPRARCRVPGCGKELATAVGNYCQSCHGGVHPGSGLDPCATEGCSKKVQRWRGEKKCHLCRRGLKNHLKPKEQSMAKPNPLDKVTEADFKASFLKYGGNLNAVGKQFGAAGSTVKRRAAELGLKLVGRKTRAAKSPNTSPNPPRALEADVQQPEPKYPGLPPVEQVPIGYAKKLHEYLLSIGVSFATEKSAA